MSGMDEADRAATMGRLRAELARTPGAHARRTRWVMDRASYDHVRAMAMTAEQETARAVAHAAAWIPVLVEAPYTCPACGAGSSFATIGTLNDHVAAMADPTNREPADGDCLFGIRIEVRDDGGAPHLERIP